MVPASGPNSLAEPSVTASDTTGGGTPSPLSATDRRDRRRITHAAPVDRQGAAPRTDCVGAKRRRQRAAGARRQHVASLAAIARAGAEREVAGRGHVQQLHVADAVVGQHGGRGGRRLADLRRGEGERRRGHRQARRAALAAQRHAVRAARCAARDAEPAGAEPRRRRPEGDLDLAAVAGGQRLDQTGARLVHRRSRPTPWRTARSR